MWIYHSNKSKKDKQVVRSS